MDLYEAAGVCYTNAITVAADNTIWRRPWCRRHGRLTCEMALTGFHPIVTSSVLFRRRFLEKRPYRPDLHSAEDYHVNLKVLWRSGEKSVFIDEPLVRYRVVKTSTLHQIDPCERGRLHTHGGRGIHCRHAS